MDPRLQTLLKQLYSKSPSLNVVFSTSGGGGSLGSYLLSTAGASSTLLELVVPYSRASLLDFVNSNQHSKSNKQNFDKFCSAEVAEELAMASYFRALRLVNDEFEGCAEGRIKQSRLCVGVGCTASIVSSLPRKGFHRCFVSIITNATGGNQNQYTYEMRMKKALNRSRVEEDSFISKFVLYCLFHQLSLFSNGVEEYDASFLLPPAVDGPFIPIIEHDDNADVDIILQHVKKIKVAEHGAEIQDLLQNIVKSITCIPKCNNNMYDIVSNFKVPCVIFPGSFNPLHEGHKQLAEIISKVLIKSRRGSMPLMFEISVSNADKGVLCHSEVSRRVEQFFKCCSFPLILTNQASLFIEKARLFPQSVFVVGADTAARLVDPKYYSGDEYLMSQVLQEVFLLGCSFIVAGRYDTKLEKYISAEEVVQTKVPLLWRKLFEVIPENEFRLDISSTELRSNQK